MPEMMAAVEGVLLRGNFKGLGAQQIARTRTLQLHKPTFQVLGKAEESWGMMLKLRVGQSAQGNGT